MTAPAAVSLAPARAPTREPLRLSPSTLRHIIAAGYTIVAADEWDDLNNALRHYQAGARAASRAPHCADCERELPRDHTIHRSPRCRKCQRLHKKLLHRDYMRERMRRIRAAAKGAK